MNKLLATLKPPSVSDLEQEKYKLLEQVKSLELSSSQIESESKRKDDKLKEFISKLSAAHLKIQGYKDRLKDENKAVCGLVRKVGEIMRQVVVSNQNVVAYITRVFHGLAIQKETELGNLELFDPSEVFNGVFSDEFVNAFKKIDMKKLKTNVMTGWPEGPNLKEAVKLFDSTYSTLLTRMQSCNTSFAELTSLRHTFDSHAHLMRQSTDLLRQHNPATAPSPPVATAQQHCVLDDSIAYSSRGPRLADDSLHTAPRRSRHHQHSRTFTLDCDQSLLETDFGGLCEPLDSPHAGGGGAGGGTSHRPPLPPGHDERWSGDERRKQQVHRLVDEDTTLSLDLCLAKTYEHKLEAKVKSLQGAVETKRKEVETMRSKRVELERELEEAFGELESLEVHCVELGNSLAVLSNNQVSLRRRIAEKRQQSVDLARRHSIMQIGGSEKENMLTTDKLMLSARKV